MLSRGANKTEGKGSETMTMTGRRGGDNGDDESRSYRLPFRSTSIYLLHRPSKSEKPGQGNAANSIRRAQLRKQFKCGGRIWSPAFLSTKLKMDPTLQRGTSGTSCFSFPLRLVAWISHLTSSRGKEKRIETEARPVSAASRAERGGLKISCRGRHSRCR